MSDVAIFFKSWKQYFVPDLPVVQAAVSSPGANKRFLLDAVMQLKRQTFPSHNNRWLNMKISRPDFFFFLLQGHGWNVCMRVWNHPGLRSCTLCLVRLTSATEPTHYRTINTPLARFRLNKRRQSSCCLRCICLNAILHLLSLSRIWCDFRELLSTRGRQQSLCCIMPSLPGHAIHTHRRQQLRLALQCFLACFWFTKRWITFWKWSFLRHGVTENNEKKRYSNWGFGCSKWPNPGRIFF